MAVTDKISELVSNQFPDFYKEEGENFLAFMKAYYAWMETTGQLTDGVRNLESYRDISTTTDAYIDYFRNDFLPSVPNDMVASKKLAVKYVKYFNQSRGTFEAYKLLFRAVYGEDIDLNLPADQILKVSDGDWRIDRYLVARYDANTYDFIGKNIVGVESGAVALVEDVIRRTIRNKDIVQILLSNVVGTFTHLEPIRLETDIAGSGHTPIVDAGINRISITSGGGEFQEGDVISIASDDIGEFGKVIVTSTLDLGGTITFTIANGGSGYRASTDDPGSTITIAGGDGSGATFVVEPDDIDNAFPIYLVLNVNAINDRTTFSTLAPSIVSKDGIRRKMTLYANTIIGAPRYGFAETTAGEAVQNYHEYGSAILRVANTKAISVSQSLFGNTSLANGIVTSIVNASAGDTYLKVNAYKKFTPSEPLHVGYNGGSNVGLVTSFTANTYGNHVLNIANTYTINQGDELVGVSSNAFGVVTELIASASSNTYVRLSANATSNVSSQFDSGPIKAFANNENIRKVGSATVVGTAKNRTANTLTEDVHTALIDSLVFQTTAVGTITALSRIAGGSGYTTAPTVRIQDQEISALKIRDYTLTLHSDDVNWGTGNSFFTTLSTGDRVSQGSTGASGYIVASGTAGTPISVVQLANNTYETTVRVWQDIGQATFTGFANDVNTSIQTYLGAYTQGSTSPDTRTQTNSGTARIASVTTEGILGNNAVVTTAIGANGSITGVRIIDSGFNYKDGESIRLPRTSRNLAFGGRGTIVLKGAANSEGYYASSRSHLSSTRGYIQDSRYYQEFSYEIISPVSLARYRDIALSLVHPAGEALFGKFTLQSNAYVNVATAVESKKRLKANGSIAMTQGSFNITGTGTSLTANYANNSEIIVEYSPRSFYTIRLNKVSNTTFANTTIAWSNSSITSANIYYTSTSSSANIYYQVG